MIFKISHGFPLVVIYYRTGTHTWYGSFWRIIGSTSGVIKTLNSGQLHLYPDVKTSAKGAFKFNKLQGLL